MGNEEDDMAAVMGFGSFSDGLLKSYIYLHCCFIYKSIKRYLLYIKICIINSYYYIKILYFILSTISIINYINVYIYTQK